MVGVEGEAGPMVLLLAESEEALDLRPAVGPVLPLAGCPPPEGGGLGRSVSASRAPSRASTLTPLSTGVWIVVILLFSSLGWWFRSIVEGDGRVQPSKCSFV